MDFLWTSYGLPMDFLWNNMGATRQQQGWIAGGAGWWRGVAGPPPRRIRRQRDENCRAQGGGLEWRHEAVDGNPGPK